MRILAGDIGGTKTELCLYERSEMEEGLRMVQNARYPSADYPGLGELLREFLGPSPVALDAAAFGVAGPVRSHRCRTTNLAWTVDAHQLGQQLDTRVELINDFHAVALGIFELDRSGIEVLHQGEVDPAGPVAVIGAGTGLGEAMVLPGRQGPAVVVSEGGHADFAPRDETEIALLRFLLKRHDHVSWERVVSGNGLVNIYDFIIDQGLAPEKAETRAAVQAGDGGSVIGENALAGTDPACERAVRLFLSLYGAEAGNLALKVVPTGGLYIAGGIAPALAEKMREGVFLHSFRQKGRMSGLLERIRVSLVLDGRVGLLGARAHAERMRL